MVYHPYNETYYRPPFQLKVGHFLWGAIAMVAMGCFFGVACAEPNSETNVVQTGVAQPASFGATLGKIAQPQQPPQWQPGKNSTLKGRLQQAGPSQWYHASALTGAPWQPTDSSTRHALQLARQFKLDAAEVQLKTLLRQHPNNAGAHYGLALVTYYRTSSSDATYRSQQDELLAEAIQHAMDALRLKPTYVEAHLTLSKLYAERLHRLPDAEEFAAHAYALAPNNSAVLTQVGQLLLDENVAEEAVDVLKRATQTNPRNSQAYTQLGRALAAMGKSHESLKALNTAVWLQPANAPAHHLRATLYEQQHNEAAATQSYLKALAADPEYLPAAMDLANLYQRRRDVGQAMSILKDSYHSLLRTHHPARHTLALQIAEMALENRQPEVASTYYEAVLASTAESDPRYLEASKGLSKAKTWDAQETLSRAQGYGGDLLSDAQADTALQQALAAYPGNTQAKLVETKLRGYARTTDELETQKQQVTLNTPPATANDALAQGEVFSAHFDPLRAQAAYQQAARSAASATDATRMGDMLLTLGQPKAARLAFERILNGNVVIASAEELSVARQAARAGLKKLAQQEKTLQQEWATWAEYSSSDLRYVATLEAILRLDANEPEAHRQLAEYYHDRQQWVEALRHYHWFTQVAPTHDDAPQARKRIAQLTQKLMKTANATSQTQTY